MSHEIIVNDNTYLTEALGPRLHLTDPSGSTLYVANWDFDTISAYRIDEYTGVLRPLADAPYRTGRRPRAVTMHPSGRFLYAANFASASISAFRIGPDGRLTPIEGSPVTVGSAPRNMRLSPDGRFGFVSCRDSREIVSFSVNETTGVLTEVSRLCVGTRVRTCVVSPDGSLLCAGDQGESTISVIHIDTDTGHLVAGDPPHVGVELDPRSVGFNATGRHLFVANRAADSMSIFQLCPSNLTIKECKESPLPTGARPFAALITPDGNHCYVTNSRGDSISGYNRVKHTDIYREMIESPFATGVEPQWATLDPTARFLYATNELSRTVSAFRIGASGELIGIKGSPFLMRAHRSMGILPRELYVEPKGRFAYIVNRRVDSVTGFHIDPNDGALQEIPGSPFPANVRDTIRYWWITTVMNAKGLRRCLRQYSGNERR